MKKRLLAVLLSLVTVFCLSASAFALTPPDEGEVIDLGDGYYLVVDGIEQSTLTNPLARLSGTTINATKNASVYNGSVKIGNISISGNFTYNGTTAVANYGSVSGSGLNGWTYSSGSASCYAATVTGHYTFKLSTTSKSFTLYLICQPDGSVS
ncbi:MAG: hypothetical protein AB7C89_04365 [Intestinibacillus sp.]